MFNFIKNKLQKIYSTLTSRLSGIFSQQIVNQESLKELEKILIESDTGVHITRQLITTIKNKNSRKELSGQELQQLLEQELLKILAQQYYHELADVYLLVGINGSGKTTTAAKLAARFKQSGKKALLVAADTFRAAALDQLNAWAQQLAIDIVLGKPEQDPASVIFAACKQYQEQQYTTLIIDTAGRLQTKANLMKELEKIQRTITKLLPNKKVCTLLTIDSMLGQNSLEQARLFNESTKLDGLILTKMDGTGKGGIIFAISTELHVPIAYISFGEKLDDLALFDPQNYIKELLQK